MSVRAKTKSSSTSNFGPLPKERRWYWYHTMYSRHNTDTQENETASCNISEVNETHMMPSPGWQNILANAWNHGQGGGGIVFGSTNSGDDTDHSPQFGGKAALTDKSGSVNSFVTTDSNDSAVPTDQVFQSKLSASQPWFSWSLSPGVKWRQQLELGKSYLTKNEDTLNDILQSESSETESVYTTKPGQTPGLLLGSDNISCSSSSICSRKSQLQKDESAGKLAHELVDEKVLKSKGLSDNCGANNEKSELLKGDRDLVHISTTRQHCSAHTDPESLQPLKIVAFAAGSLAQVDDLSDPTVTCIDTPSTVPTARKATQSACACFTWIYNAPTWVQLLIILAQFMFVTSCVLLAVHAYTNMSEPHETSSAAHDVSGLDSSSTTDSASFAMAQDLFVENP